MKVTGIIAECNPLHEGHAYLIREARARTGADHVVVAMSGDYVQRGAPSILSCRSRAESLLREGADLVVELPLYVSCSGADYFARGGVALLESLGPVTDLVFGSESGDLDALQAAAEKLGEEDEAYRTSLRDGLRNGMTFPEARAAASGSGVPVSPNDLLGTEYLKALRASGSSGKIASSAKSAAGGSIGASGSTIRPHAVPRISCQSASEIRAQMLLARSGSDPFVCRDDFSDLLLHALWSADDLSRYLDVSGDLARRILNELPKFTTYSAFCEAVKTRNYTYTRISRALLHILLGMTSQAMEKFDNSYGLCGWIRPIGFKKSAIPLIREITASCSVPYLDKLASAEKVLTADLYGILLEEIRAEFLYDLMVAKRAGGFGSAGSSVAAGNSGSIRDSEKGVAYAFGKPLIIVE